MRAGRAAGASVRCKCETAHVPYSTGRPGGDGGWSPSVILEIARSCNTASPRGAVGVSPFRFPTSNQNVPSRMNTLTLSATVVLWSQSSISSLTLRVTHSMLDIKRHVEYTSIIRSECSLTIWQDLPAPRTVSNGLHSGTSVDQCGGRRKGKGLLGGL